MSRLTDLLRQAHKADPDLGRELEAEIAALKGRRSFGLVFEQHQPEAVALPGREVRPKDKVRILATRGKAEPSDQRLWNVERIEKSSGVRVAHLLELEADNPEEKVVIADDLVVVAEFNDHIFPGLVETGRVERGGNKPFHTVINAENYHALEMLTYTHRHSIDAIYIDPPYNTGARDWKYNNDYVEGDDDYRHSKWLAFMERRLDVAKDLLNPDSSVLIVTIDEKEYLRLGLLLEQTFPEARIQMISSVINSGGPTRQGGITRVDEYLFLVQFGGQRVAPTGQSMLHMPDESGAQRATAPAIWHSLLRGGEGASRKDSPNLFYPVFVDTDRSKIVSVGESIPLGISRDTVSIPNGLRAVWPVTTSGQEGRWRISAPVLREKLSKKRAKLGAYSPVADTYRINYLVPANERRLESGEIVILREDERGDLVLRHSSETSRIEPPKSVWNKQSHNARAYGTDLLRQLFPDRRFPFPKSLYAVEDALRFFVTDKPDAVVLDFFSGSGTTAHAVMRLNRQDGGSRQCISVTNNEVSADEQRALRKEGLRPGDPEWEALGICEYITKPRLTAAITGRTPKGDPIKGDYKFTDEFPMSEGFEENAAFFTLTYESPLTVRHHRAFERVAPMLWLRAGSQGRVIDRLSEGGWDVADVYGVIKNIDRMPEFLARVEDVASVTTVYIVTDSDAAFQSACRDLPERVTAVRLYESYLQNFTINRRAGA